MPTIKLKNDSTTKVILHKLHLLLRLEINLTLDFWFSTLQMSIF